MKRLFRTIDCFCVVFVAFVSFLTRIWLIADPDRVTFDEVHFGNFTNWYIQGFFHFDIHPPLAKMIMASIAKLTQYKGDIDYASKFGEPYNPDESHFVSQRITCAIFSSFTSPLMFTACRCLRMSSLSATCASIILTCDISLIVEGKFILSDGLLHFFVMLHVFCLCLFLANPTLSHTILAGATLGAAASCKYTSLGLFAVFGGTQLVWIFRARPSIPLIFYRAFVILGPAFVVFIGSWYWHFISTPFAGYHSEFGSALARNLINKSRADTEYWGNRLIGPPVLARIWYWNQIMHTINMKSALPHPYESRPLYWPLLMDKWVGFISIGDTRFIRCMGTPFVYWFSFAGLVIAILCFPLGKSDSVNALLIWGWAVSYFPFFLVPRTLYLYHYIIPLMFAVMNLAAVVERILPRYSAVVLALLCFGCFLFFSPWCYGISCPKCQDRLLWTQRWCFGPPDASKPLVNTTEMYADLPL